MYEIMNIMFHSALLELPSKYTCYDIFSTVKNNKFSVKLQFYY